MSRSILFYILIVCLLLSFGGVAFANQPQGTPILRGTVLESSIQESYEFESWEIQIVQVRITSGDLKNEVITVQNTLTGHPFFDLKVKKGDRVLIQQGQEEPLSGEYHLVDFAREKPLLYITLLFILSVLIIGGVQGIKAIVSLMAMGAVIIMMILPLVLKGYNPIVVTVGLSSAITGLFILFVGGYSRKTVAATCGTIGGLIASGILALVVGNGAYLTGLASEEAQMLQFMNTTIDAQGLLFSGMIIGALGAILDVGISIASAMEQIKEADPKTDFKTLFTRGFLVGRDLVATMSNTLILAYVGSSLPLLLLFHAHQEQWLHTLNLDLVATEIIRAMTGSIGLTLAIPITAFVAALLFVNTKDESKNLSN